jgi:hypothetical protein
MFPDLQYSKDVFKSKKAEAVAFWRAMGFRRIGSSQWFCYAMDPEHLSCHLAIEDDFDPAELTTPVEGERRWILLDAATSLST